MKIVQDRTSRWPFSSCLYCCPRGGCRTGKVPGGRRGSFRMYLSRQGIRKQYWREVRLLWSRWPMRRSSWLFWHVEVTGKGYRYDHPYLWLVQKLFWVLLIFTGTRFPGEYKQDSYSFGSLLYTLLHLQRLLSRLTPIYSQTPRWICSSSLAGIPWVRNRDQGFLAMEPSLR